MTDVLDEAKRLIDNGYYASPRFVRELVEYATELKEESDHYDAIHKMVMEERCPTDEVHCTCVPHLRREITTLRKEVERWKGVAEEYSDCLKRMGE